MRFYLRKLAQQPEDQREEDAEEDGSSEWEIELCVAAATAPVQVSGEASEREAETRSQQHGRANRYEDKTKTEECFA